MPELLIIGAGPAGLSAAIYGIRAGLDVEVIEKLSPGGHVMYATEIENFPGYSEPVAGWDLMAAIEKQARRLGAKIISGEIVSLEKKKDGTIIAATKSGEISCKAVIIATGTNYRLLGVPGELENIGKGVSYCGTCDGAFFRNKTVAVIGGGNTALEEAYFLTKFASKIYLVHRRDEFRADKAVQDKVFSHPKIEKVLSCTVKSINSDGKVKSITLNNLKNSSEEKLEVEGVFIFVGVDPNTSFVPGEIKSEDGVVTVNINMETSIGGIFAAGDIRSKSKKQIVTACADGATAAMSAYEYLTK